MLLLLDQFLFTFNKNNRYNKKIIGRMKRIGKNFKNKRIQ